MEATDKTVDVHSETVEANRSQVGEQSSSKSVEQSSAKVVVDLLNVESAETKVVDDLDITPTDENSNKNAKNVDQSVEQIVSRQFENAEESVEQLVSRQFEKEFNFESGSSTSGLPPVETWFGAAGKW